MIAQLFPTWLGVLLIVVFLGMVVVGVGGILVECGRSLRKWMG